MQLKVFWALTFLLLNLTNFSWAEEASADSSQNTKTPTNKLLQMYELFYLPFTIEFKQGKTFNDIFPLVADAKGDFTQLLKPEQLKLLDQEYTSERISWAKNSLFLSTSLEINESQRITQRLIAHRIPLKKTAWDKVSVSDQIKVKSLLEGKPELIKKAVTQVQFLRSFLQGYEEEKFNFFIIGPQWCESSREYRYLLEYLSKKFPNPQLILHSVVVEDPQEQIFDSQLMKDLFPFPENYSHDSVPRFLAIQKERGQLKVLEEGDALAELKNRFFGQHRGFLDSALPSLRKITVPTKFMARPNF